MAHVLQGLQLLSPSVLAYIALGSVVCSIVTIIPGTSGSLALVILLPIAYTAPKTQALAMLVAVAAVSGTANSITGILFGIPSTSAGVAVTFDGYPLTQRGEGVRAIAAALTSALFGGVVGAAALAVLLPVAQPLVLSIGPPEFCAIIILALVLIATIGGQNLYKGLISGGLGIMLSFVGQQPSSGILRFTGGSLYLFQGIPLVPMLLGLFAVAEMINLASRASTSIGGGHRGTLVWRQGYRGFLDVLVHWPIFAIGSAIGTFVGLVPGIGATAAQFMSYGAAAKYSKNAHNFGSGAIEGVIAADAATNSKEGGALLPTLSFGIPGSDSAVILLAALVVIGVTPGPTFYAQHAPLFWLFVVVLVVAHLIATVFAAAITKPIQLITEVRVGIIIPIILTVSLYGAFTASDQYGDILTVLVFGIVGYFFQQTGYSRSNLIIGFVLGSLLENNYILAQETFGPGFLLRPGVLGILSATVALPVVFFGAGRLRRRRRHEKGPGDPADAPGSLAEQPTAPPPAH